MPAPADQPVDPFLAARQRMVRGQMNCWDRSVTDARVLAAMARVPRHEFVPHEFRASAYEDHPLPIGHDQTISQPYIVAAMTEYLQLRATDGVLEIGTGCGYQTAILAEIAAAVYSIEVVSELARQAATVLRQLGYTNIHLRIGDGYHGWPEAAPFNGIIVTCAPEQVPPPLFQQLAEGGRLIVPVTMGGYQELILCQKRGQRLERHALFPVRFVPMTGAAERGPSAR
jgi:protein-L-isoaspartate(D-aspartate) O-methyltransferase